MNRVSDKGYKIKKLGNKCPMFIDEYMVLTKVRLKERVLNRSDTIKCIPNRTTLIILFRMRGVQAERPRRKPLQPSE